MNIVLSGPFGMGSLSDEIVLAGVLKPLLAAKHAVTVLSADKDATEKSHGVKAVLVPSAGSLLSTPEAWKALGDAHLFVLCGAGCISDKGKVPARTWLMQFEHVKQLKIPTALVGVGAVFIADKKEQVRVQRLLHHFIDGIAVRNTPAKEALSAMALNPNRVSMNGDPALALFDAGRIAKAIRPSDGIRRAAFFFADGLPMRHAFSPEPTSAPETLSSGLNAVLKKLVAEKMGAVIFHDDTRQNEKLARGVAKEVEPSAISFKSPRSGFKELDAAMASCSVAITDTLHGLLFAAAHGVPAVYLHDSSEIVTPTKKLGLAQFQLEANVGILDPERAFELMSAALNQLPEERKLWLDTVSVLERKEAQNVRMLERLVPKRMRYPKPKEGDEPRHRELKKKKREREGDEGRGKKAPEWNRY